MRESVNKADREFACVYQLGCEIHMRFVGRSRPLEVVWTAVDAQDHPLLMQSDNPKRPLH
ncbi:hypothetical protein A8B75_07895 [Sphingomonadales bacterium EhC05]|nr:hypothetical protein A8B75_07895 [Sphingomonadales bacterium EhC05]